MGAAVNGGRAEQARATRQRIVDAAGRRFLRDGYAATTLRQIAEDSGVAVQTVYFHFGNKRTVLKEIVDVASVGDDDPVPLLDRPWADELRRAHDAPGALAVWMRISRDVFGRVAPVLSIVRDAASNDPDMAAQWKVNADQRHAAHRWLAERLDERGALRAGLSVDGAADELFALISLEVYVLLTGEREWSPQQWEDWAVRTAASAVLAPAPSDA